MSRFLIILSVWCLCAGGLRAQVLPADGSELNYRIIGFSFPATAAGKADGPGKYTVTIAHGRDTTEAAFAQNVLSAVNTDTTRVIADVPAFGAAYTWRVTAHGPRHTADKSPLYHFTTGSTPDVDTAVKRLRVLKSAVKYKDAYVFLDANKVLYDMNGQPVWYLPNIENIGDQGRDLKLSPQGTITFLVNNGALEVDYNAQVLWRAPQHGVISRDTVENYHHEFTRLSNGHYMILSYEYLSVLSQYAANGDSSLLLLRKDELQPPNSRVLLNRMPFATLIEFDDHDKVVWSWRTASYFNGSDIYYHTLPNGAHNVNTHENSFFFDEKNQVAYISCKNISRILRIKYPEGKVLDAYGETYIAGVPEQNNGLFCGQHSVRRTKNGYLYLYNNNACTIGSTALPSLLVMQEPANSGGALKKIWEYNCTVDSGQEAMPGLYHFQVGGNVLEMPGGEFFASMSGGYSKVFIVNRDKELLWSALPEKKDTATKMWTPQGEYRGSIITSRKELERLIWNTGQQHP